jgi:RNA polymerase sigma-70 factor (ECF subfamily)
VDQTTLAMLKEGDPSTIDAIIAFINQFARRRGIPPSDADELAVRTVAAAYEAADGYRGEAKVETWLCGIAARIWAGNCRERARRSGRTESLDDGRTELADPHEDVEQMAMDRMIAEDAVKQLSEEERQALLLRLAGLTSEEIAQQMGKTVDAVRSLKYRATQRLARHLRELDALAGDDSEMGRETV